MNAPTILVIEDNELNLKLAKTLLQRGSFRVLEAADAETGLEIARSAKPDLILMDIQLPGMDGLTATRILKKDPVLKKIPIAAMTSYAMEKDLQKAKEAGCDGYITKPIDTRTFLGTARKFLQKDHPLSLTKIELHPYKKKILIVDDEPMNLNVLQDHLLQNKYEVLQAQSGAEALEIAVQESPDLILLDVGMPEMDGCEVIRRLKMDPQSLDVLAILVTPPGALEEKLNGLEAGADEFLSKPVQKTELLTRIRSLILYKQLREQFTIRNQVETLFQDPLGNWAVWEQRPDRQRILVVEDRPQDVNRLQHYLKEMPWEVEEVTRGEEALRLLENKSFDLVLPDLHLPGMDGLEICRRLKARDQTRNIQVLLLACWSDFTSNALSFPIGADDLLVKPLNGIELQVRIGTLLKKKTYLDRLHHIKENNFNEGITDPGTGLYNRSFLRHFLNLEVKRSLRQKYPLTLLMCAICDFPKILNSRGLEAGERILWEVGHLLQENFREIDLPVHCGEEVFAMVLPYTDSPGALKGAARVRKVIQDHSFLKDSAESPLKIDIQMGISFYSSSELKVDEFIRKAEEALFQAKKEGKPFLLLEDMKEMVP
jgi:two-component system, cell cycle response regulator